MSEPFSRVVLGGLPRSGSTLLQELLSEYLPDVFSPPEIPLFPLNFEKIKMNCSYLQKRLKDIYNLDEALVFEIVEVSKNHVDLMDRISIVVGNQLSISYRGWSNKYPTNIHVFQNLQNSFGFLKFWIHLRNPIDVLLSKVPSRPNPNEYYCSLERFKKDASQIISINKSNVIITKYEDLVSDPLKFLRSTTSRIGLGFPNQVKKIQKISNPYPINTIFDYRIAQNISLAQSKKYNSSDRQYIEYLLKDLDFVHLSSKLGYSFEDFSFE